MDRYQQLLIDGVVGFMIFASAGEEPAAQAKPGESRRPSSLTASQKSHTPPGTVTTDIRYQPVDVVHGLPD